MTEATGIMAAAGTADKLPSGTGSSTQSMCARHRTASVRWIEMVVTWRQIEHRAAALIWVEGAEHRITKLDHAVEPP